MNIQIDVTTKTIRLEQGVNLSELVNTLDLIFGEGLWKDYYLDIGIKMPFDNPIIIRETMPWFPDRPIWEQPTVTSLNGGLPPVTTFNIQF